VKLLIRIQRRDNAFQNKRHEIHPGFFVRH
jgi:hypothetical protein